MKVNRESFLKELKVLSSVINKGGYLPILECVNFNEKGLQVTDLSASMSITKSSCDVSGAVNLHRLISVVSRMAGYDIELKNEALNFVVNDGRSKVTILGEDGNDFPALHLPPVLFILYMKNVAGSDIKDMTKFLSKDELRPSMTGVFLGTDMVATDAHLLHKKTGYSIENTYQQEPGIIIPSKVCKILGSHKLNYEIYTNNSNDFTTPIPGGFNLVWKGIEGRYPNYNAVIPTQHSTIASINATELRRMVSIASQCCNSVTKRGKFVFENVSGVPQLTISSGDVNDNGCSFSETIALNSMTSNGGVEIGFNLGLLSTLLSVVRTEEVTFYMTENNKAAVINKELLIMPVMGDDY